MIFLFYNHTFFKATELSTFFFNFIFSHLTKCCGRPWTMDIPPSYEIFMDYLNVMKVPPLVLQCSQLQVIVWYFLIISSYVTFICYMHTIKKNHVKIQDDFQNRFPFSDSLYSFRVRAFIGVRQEDTVIPSSFWKTNLFIPNNVVQFFYTLLQQSLSSLKKSHKTSRNQRNQNSFNLHHRVNTKSDLES